MADTARAATGSPEGSFNSFNVKDVFPLEYDGDDFLTTKTYHGVSITTKGNTSVVGRIQSWQPDSYTREGIHLYELADMSFGRPVEFVPGRATGFTIAVTRAEVWEAEMELAFGEAALLEDLIDQTKPFSINEFWYRGPEVKLIWEYRGCWFTNKNMDAITADGDGITKISGTIAYVSRRKTF